MTPWGSPIPGCGRFVITFRQPSVHDAAARAPTSIRHAGVGRCAFPRAISAQATRAVLFARATAAAFGFFRAINAMIHAPPPRWRNILSIAVAPTTRRRRIRPSTILLIPACRSLPPLLHARGVRPSQAATCLRDRNRDGSGTLASMAVAVIGPTPGLAPSRLPASLARCQPRIRFSSPAISASSVVS